MAEIIATLVIIGIIAAITVPAMVGFAERGKQTNRMNTARTIYLAAQSQLNQKQIERNLKSTMTGHYFQKTEDGFFTEILDPARMNVNSVGPGLFPSADNPGYIRYVSKPAGTLSADANDELRCFYDMLDDIIMDKSVLDGAILMEYNIRTGLVLSVFYGDAGQSEFVYGSANGRRSDITGGRGADQNAYQYADQRRQGYYGADMAEDLPPIDLPDIVNIFDGASTPETALVTPADKKINILYAEFLIKKSDQKLYTFNIVNALDTGSVILTTGEIDLNSIGLAGIADSFESGILSPANKIYRAAHDVSVYQNGYDYTDHYQRYIWVLDYIDGDISLSQPHSIGLRIMQGSDTVITPQNVRAAAVKGDGTGTVSSTSANTHYAGEMRGVRSYEIVSARHLNNIRYNSKDAAYRQTADISMESITNFPPLTAIDGQLFEGVYYGLQDDGTGHKIENLTIISSANNVGLFSQTSIGSKIQGISFIGLTINSPAADYIGAVSGSNHGTISDITTDGASITGRNYTGGITGRNFAEGSIEGCLISNSTVTNSLANIGGVAGKNDGILSRIGVAYSTVRSAALSDRIGGVTGNNNGRVEDVYFLSTNAVGDIPISESGGGIAGNNSGAVARAFYMAPPPKSVSGSGSSAITTIYPIVRSGNPSETIAQELTEYDTSFFLSGHTHRLNNDTNWTNEKYSLTTRLGIDYPVLRSGGGQGLITRFLFLEWLEFAYHADLSNWYQPTLGYPYPTIRNLPIPQNWVEANSPPRPDQLDYDDWLPTQTIADRAIAPEFVNGSFTNPFLRSIPTGGGVDNIYVPPYQHISRNWFSADMDIFNGWYTRPLDRTLFNPANPLYFFPTPGVSGEDLSPAYTSSSIPRWRLIEMQEPNGVNDYMRTSYSGQSFAKSAITDTANNVRTDNSHRYVELNAETPGTLYQVLPTTPGAQFTYSFYHATNGFPGYNPGTWYTAPTAAGDRMNFYLSNFEGDESSYIVSTAAQAELRDGSMTMIRPCQSPRSAPTVNGTAITTAANATLDSANAGVTASNNVILNPAAWNTVAYGASNQAMPTGTNSGGPYNLSYHRGRSYLQPTGQTVTQNIPNGTLYLYDVWVGATNTSAGNGGTRSGYGITFWSTSNITNLAASGYATLAAIPATLRNDAQNNVIGYWGVSYGWKHYYGEYTVPAGQSQTEFAFQAGTGPSRVKSGNYLDGVSFKSSSFLTVDKCIKDSEGRRISFVKPGDELTVELIIKNWGEIAADNIIITDRMSPFNEYVEYVEGSVRVMRGGTLITAVNSYSSGVLTVTPPAAARLAANEEMTVTFRINVRRHLSSDALSDTLLYFFKNQAEISYRADRETNENRFAVYSDRVCTNSSGPGPVQVFIDPVHLDKTITTADNSNVDGPFTVKLRIQNALEGGGSISTQGISSIVIPGEFQLTSHEIVRRTNGDWAPTEPPIVSFTTNPDGATRITIWDVGVGEVTRSIEYTYEIRYVGNGYGTAFTHLSADYRYLYQESNLEPISVMLSFPEEVVGISVKTNNSLYTAAGNATHVFDITSNDDFSLRLADDNYDVTPTVVLTDADGNPLSGVVIVDGNQQIDNEFYTARIVRGTWRLEFVPKTSGTYEIYYRIMLTATKPNNPSFVLDSPPTKVTVTM